MTADREIINALLDKCEKYEAIIAELQSQPVPAAVPAVPAVVEQPTAVAVQPAPTATAPTQPEVKVAPKKEDPVKIVSANRRTFSPLQRGQ
jgi:hypothetical protein